MYGYNQGLAFNLSHGNYRLRQHLTKLTIKELVVLSRHQDLLKRAEEIADAPAPELVPLLRNHFGMEVTHVGAGSPWVVLSEAQMDTFPEEIGDWCAEVGHTGWMHVDIARFVGWARDILMEEIRINIMVRYINHKRERTKKRGDASGSIPYYPGQYI